MNYVVVAGDHDWQFHAAHAAHAAGKRGLLNWGAAVLPRAKSRFPTLAFARG